MRIGIRGRNLPGRRFSCADGPYENVHVAVQSGTEPLGLVPGDSPSASWDIEVRVAIDDDGHLDFRGPVVHGKRGDRFIYLTWGEVADDPPFTMFRRAKLMLNRIDADLVRTAEKSDRPLIAAIDLTDDRGGPRCARVDPPALSWALA